MRVHFRNGILFDAGKLKRDYTEEQIMDEPMLFSASPQFAKLHGGIITHDFLEQLYRRNDWDDLVKHHEAKGYEPVIDTKVVRLMEGQYPCIPGWHCDGVPRPDKHSQPDMTQLNENIWHFLGTVSSHSNGVSNTKFISTPLSLNVNVDEKVWGQVNKKVNRYLTQGDIEAIETEDDKLYGFRRDSIHAGMPAKRNGHRFFFRLSFYHMPPRNEKRKQVQVYANPNKGW